MNSLIRTINSQIVPGVFPSSEVSFFQRTITLVPTQSHPIDLLVTTSVIDLVANRNVYAQMEIFFTTSVLNDEPSDEDVAYDDDSIDCDSERPLYIDEEAIIGGHLDSDDGIETFVASVSKINSSKINKLVLHLSCGKAPILDPFLAHSEKFFNDAFTHHLHTRPAPVVFETQDGDFYFFACERGRREIRELLNETNTIRVGKYEFSLIQFIAIMPGFLCLNCSGYGGSEEFGSGDGWCLNHLSEDPEIRDQWMADRMAALGRDPALVERMHDYYTREE